MKVTEITSDNAEYFEDLIPEGYLENENLLWLGAIAGDGTACAVLGSGVYEDMAYIEWIYTDPSYRKEGAARALMKLLKTFLRKVKVKILQISFSEDDENLEEFLEDEGFIVNDDRESYSFPVRDLIYSEMIDRYGEEHDSVDRVVTLAGFEKPDAFYEYMQGHGIPFVKASEDLSSSLIRINKEGEIEGCMLISRLQDGDIEISYLISDGPAGSAIDLFLAFKKLAGQMGWLDDSIVFTDRSGETIRIIETIAGADRDSYIISKQKTGLTTL